MGQQVLGRHRSDTGAARRGAVNAGEIEALARLFVREHGPRAAARAIEWANLMLMRGDRGGHWLWRGVLWAIEELRHRELRAAADLPLDPGLSLAERNYPGARMPPGGRAAIPD